MRASLVLMTMTFFANTVLCGDVTYGGDGCPAGTARVSQNGDGEIKLSLATYDAQLSAGTAERRSCNIAIATTVPAGYSANFGTVQLLGSYDLAVGTSATVNAEGFLVGNTGPVFSTNYNGQASGVIAYNFTPNTAWTACGASTIMRLNTSMVLKASKNGQAESRVRIDEIIVGKPILRRCS